MAVAGILLMAGAAIGSPQRLQHWFDAPAQSMAINGPQTSQGFLFSPATSGLLGRLEGLNALPVSVDFRNSSGALTRNTPTTVEVRLAGGGNLHLEGRLIRPARSGRADFPDLAVRGVGPFRLEFHAGELAPATSQPLFAANRTEYPEFQFHRVVGGALNDQPLDSAHRVIRVAPGAVLRGSLQFRTFTAAHTAAQLAGAVALWGDRRTNWIALQALPPHGESVWETELRDPGSHRELRAPSTPGRYWLVLVVEAETEMKYIASRTNWVLGEPQWLDGNDILDLAPAQLRQLDSLGVIPWPKTFADPSRPAQSISRSEAWLVGTLLEIVVQSP